MSRDYAERFGIGAEQIWAADLLKTEYVAGLEYEPSHQQMRVIDMACLSVIYGNAKNESLKRMARFARLPTDELIFYTNEISTYFNEEREL